MRFLAKATIIFLILFTQISVAQVVTEEVDSLPDIMTINDFINDSLSNNSNMFAIEDSLYQYVSSDSVYKNWDTDTIHSHKYDFTKKNDTTYVILINKNKGLNYCPPTNGVVTSDFGWRRFQHHYGIDTRLKKGDSVYCAFDGFIRIARRSRSYGNVVVVRHFNGLETLYAHLSKSFVKSNQFIKAGETVGLGGNTGRSFGNHLHFEIRYFGEAINPHEIIDFNTYKLLSDTLVLTKKNFEYLIEVRKAKYHKIRKGDSLGKIARKYGTTIREICRLNHITPKKLLRVGRNIRYR